MTRPVAAIKSLRFALFHCKPNCITGPLWGKSTSAQWIPLINGQWCRKHFQIMISSWQQTFYPGLNKWNGWSPHRCTGVFWCISPSTWLFLQQLVQAYYKENSQQSFVLLALCEENPPVTSGVPSQIASDAESISKSWYHHDSRHFIQAWISEIPGLLIGVLVYMSERPINEIIISGGSRPCSWPPDVLGATLVAGSGTPPAPVPDTSPTGQQAEWKG